MMPMEVRPRTIVQLARETRDRLREVETRIACSAEWNSRMAPTADDAVRLLLDEHEARVSRETTAG